MPNTFMTIAELDAVGFCSIGSNVLISRHTCIHGAENMRLGSNVRIDDFCFLSGKLTFGSHVHIAAGVYLYGSLAGIEFEDYTTTAPRVTIHADSDDYSGAFMTNPTVSKEYTNVRHAPVLIQQHSIIGSGCIILPGVTLGEGSAVGAMSLVLDDTNPWTINHGVPCRESKARSRELLALAKRHKAD
jgi:galactoside O-acetyltransferase